MPFITKEKVKRKLNSRMLSRRLDYAKFLLVQTTVPLETVAADCGWKSASAFTDDFQFCVGVTPVHYRNWHQCQTLSESSEISENRRKQFERSLLFQV